MILCFIGSSAKDERGRFFFVAGSHLVAKVIISHVTVSKYFSGKRKLMCNIKTHLNFWLLFFKTNTYSFLTDVVMYLDVV